MTPAIQSEAVTPSMTTRQRIRIAYRRAFVEDELSLDDRDLSGIQHDELCAQMHSEEAARKAECGQGIAAYMANHSILRLGVK